jgi:hypothetical protein
MVLMIEMVWMSGEVVEVDALTLEVRGSHIYICRKNELER